MKDNFSRQANLYQKFRPVYPQELYNFLFSLLSEKKTAWDCATGNGQVAGVLAGEFEKVYATDISQKQLDNAIQKSNIIYQLCPAEQTHFADQTFDLITVGQAVHWFEFDKFNAEAARVLKPNGVLAIWGYGLLNIIPEIDTLVNYLYDDILDTYWDPERRHVENKLESIPFPYKAIVRNDFEIQETWTVERLIGYLNTWSSTQKYIKTHNENPVDKIAGRLLEIWPAAENKIITIPVFLKTGKI